MAVQWLRKFNLIIGDEDGNGIDLSDLHCKFQSIRQDTGTLANGLVRIYNLSPDTARKIEKEFVHVWLSAGYRENSGLIFSGSISQKIFGRESSTDTFLEIVAQDGDMGYNWAIANSSLAAGYRKDDYLNEVVRPMGDFGVKPGYIPQFDQAPSPRGRAIFGMCRDHVRSLAATTRCGWHIEDGKINLIPEDEPLPNEAIELTAATGLIGMPQQTVDGVQVRCLLNPAIRYGTTLKINNESIQGARLPFGIGAYYVPNLDADGLYKVYSVTHQGDTRGNPWYTDIVAIALNGEAPISTAFVSATPAKRTTE